MGRKDFNVISKVDSTNYAMELCNVLKGRFNDVDFSSKAIVLSFLVLKLQDNGRIVNCSLDNILSDELFTKEEKEIIYRHCADCFDIAISMINRFTSDVIISFVLFGSFNSNINKEYDNCFTPESIIRLGSKMLDITTNDRVLDLCSGQGGFMVHNYDIMEDFTSLDINYKANDCSYLKMILLSKEFNIKLNNALTYIEDEKFDKIFANYPYMLKVGIDEYRSLLSNELNLSGLTKSSSDWLFNASIIRNLSRSGKAIGIVTNGTTLNVIDREIRKNFIESGFIEAVISLPERMFDFTTIPVTMIVFSYENTKVSMIDATNICTRSRRNNTFDDKDINQIISCIGVESEISTVKDISEFNNSDYILNPKKYLSTPTVENGIELASLVKSISRGASLKASELDKLSSEVVTGYKYLSLSNIKNNILNYEEDIMNLREIPSNYMKYQLKENMIILSKVGKPTFKSAIVHLEGDITLIPSSNFIVLEIDTEKANPHYIQAFLSSEKGLSLLESSTSGSVIPIISADSLKKILIPYVSLEEQNVIANKYAANLDNIKILQKQLKKAVSRVANLFNEEV